MSSTTPTVFVSSTCYDLKQIRQDLNHFLKDELGFEPMLSETSSFPVDPQLNTIDNCTRNVDEHADIFVLIIGCRYGMVTDSGKSITNLEYLHAKQTNIPIYVFIEKSILSNIQFWKDNPTGTFTSMIDNPKLFEFVDSIRSVEKWTYPYEHAGDIIATLRSQLAYLFRESLKVRSLITRTTLTNNLRLLSGEALNIYLTKPSGWEFRLFSAVLINDIVELENKRRDLAYGISYADKRQFDSVTKFLNYIIEKVSKLDTLVDNISTQIKVVHVDAMGPSGQNGNADLIVYNAKSIISIYSSIIDWTLDGFGILPSSEQEDVVKCIPEVSKTTLQDIERFVNECREAVSTISETLPAKENPKATSVCLTISEPNVTGMNKAIAALAKRNNIEIT